MTITHRVSLAVMCAFAAAGLAGCAQPSMTAEQWDQQVAGAPTPVLVEFWRPGCSACKTLRPKLAALVDHYDGKVVLYEINTNTTSDLADANNVRKLPAVLLFVDGEQVGRWDGELDIEPYRKALAEHLVSQE